MKRMSGLPETSGRKLSRAAKLSSTFRGGATGSKDGHAGGSMLSRD